MLSSPQISHRVNSIASCFKAEPQSAAFYLSRALSLTWSGVDLFFVLSGFLIGGILMDNRRAPHYFKAFYIRRACRIFPLYFLWLLLFIVLINICGHLPSFNWLLEKPLPLWSYATFTQNFVMAHEGRFGPNWMGITWSLAIEEQFYLFLPLLIYLTPPRILPLVLIVLISAAPLLRNAVFALPPHPGFAAYVWMPCRADALLLGALCACAIRHPKTAQFLTRYNLIFYLVMALAAVCLGVITWHSPPPDSPAMVFFGYPLLALLYGCFLWVAVTETRGPVSALVRNRHLGQLGVLAYGVYLFHQAVNGLMHALLFGQAPQINNALQLVTSLASLGFTWLLATLSWRYLEKPCVAFGHSFTYHDFSPSGQPIQPQKSHTT